MEEQAKNQEEQQDGNAQVSEPKEDKKSSEKLKSLLKIILGIALIFLGLLGVIIWRYSLWTVFKGCIGLFLILAGAITIAIAKE